VHWTRATYPAVHDLLSNLVYAEAFVFGRTQTERRIVRPARWCHGLSGCPVSSGRFIDWPTHEVNTARLRENWSAPRGFGGGVPREGAALLQGRLRCGKCSRLMQTGYSEPKATARAMCVTAPNSCMAVRQAARGWDGRRLENRVLEEVFAG